MNRVSHMALWLVAVIVLIAVGVMPSGAQAHTGHPHDAPAQGVSAPAAMAAALPDTASTIVANGVVRTSMARTGIESPCDGVCCNTGCHAGTSCCTGAGLAVDTGGSDLSRRPGERALARALPARTDVVPEALPEPPRSFA